MLDQRKTFNLPQRASFGTEAFFDLFFVSRTPAEGSEIERR